MSGRVTRIITRHHQGRVSLSQLEYIDGELWANVWQTECIARVNLTTGHVSHWMLMHGLRDSLLRRPGTQRGLLDVLNGVTC